MLNDFKLGAIHLTGRGLYSLARLSQGDIKEILVRLSNWRYYANDVNAHIVIDGSGHAYTNKFSLLDEQKDQHWRPGRAIVSILAGYKPTKGAPVQGSCHGSAVTEGSPEPPNEKQLKSVAHVLAIMCLGLRLTIDSIKVIGEFSFEPTPAQPSSNKRHPSLNVRGKKSAECELACVPTGGRGPIQEHGAAKGVSAKDLIRTWTAAILEDMKNGLFSCINPDLAKEALVIKEEINGFQYGDDWDNPSVGCAASSPGQGSLIGNDFEKEFFRGFGV